jgi:hypothetical protein
VRVVVVAEVEHELGPARRRRRGELLGRLVDAQPFEHPLGADADVAPEQPLQGARGDVVFGGHIFDPRLERRHDRPGLQGLEVLAFGTHVPGDGEMVAEWWTG